MKKQRVWVLVLVLLAIVVLESPAQRRESGHWQEKALHLAIFFPSNGNFDPIKSSYISLQPLYRAIYATLCKLDPELRAYSSLAESIEQSGSTFSVQLRKEAAFSDGSDITAMNVIGSIEHCLSSLQHSTPLWQMIEGAEDFVNGKSAFCSGLKIVNPKRVEIQLKGKNPQFAHYLTSTLLAIQPTHRNQNQNKNAFSGPFAISAIHNKGKEVIVTLKRNPYYFGRKSKVDVLYFHFYPYRVDFDHAISSGQMDLFLYNDYFKIPFSKYRYNYFKTPIYGSFYLQLNPIKGPFKDKQFRKFFKDCILSLDICTDMRWELTIPAKLVLPYGLTGYSLFNQIKPGDISKQIPSRKIKLVAININSEFKQELFQLLKQKLARYNIDLDLQWEEEEHILQREKNGDYDIISYLYMVDVPLSSYFYQSLFVPGYGLNVSRYEVPEASRLISEYNKESDELAGLRILARLEELAQDEAVLIPLMTPLAILGYKQNLQNVKMDKYLTINFEDIDVK